MGEALITLPIEWQKPIYAGLAVSMVFALTAMTVLYYVIKTAVRDGMREALSAQPISQDYIKAYKDHTKRIEPVTQPMDLRATR